MKKKWTEGESKIIEQFCDEHEELYDIKIAESIKSKLPERSVFAICIEVSSYRYRTKHPKKLLINPEL